MVTSYRLSKLMNKKYILNNQISKSYFLPQASLSPKPSLLSNQYYQNNIYC
jgi:hypothetical protein